MADVRKLAEEALRVGALSRRAFKGEPSREEVIARALVAALSVVEAAAELADASNAFEGEPTIIAPREPDAQTLRIVRAIAGTVKAVTTYREGK